MLAAEEAALDGDEATFLAADEAFHLGVVELAGNQTLDLLVRMIYAIIEKATASSTSRHKESGDQLALRATNSPQPREARRGAARRRGR